MQAWQRCLCPLRFPQCELDSASLRLAHGLSPYGIGQNRCCSCKHGSGAFARFVSRSAARLRFAPSRSRAFALWNRSKPLLLMQAWQRRLCPLCFPQCCSTPLRSVSLTGFRPMESVKTAAAHASMAAAPLPASALLIAYVHIIP